MLIGQIINLNWGPGPPGHTRTPTQARSQDLKKREAILKEWDYRKRPWPEFSLFRPITFGQIRKFKRFFSPKTSELQKKKVFAKFETDFSAKSGNSNAFSAQKQVISKKKRHRRIWNGFFGQNRKFIRFFRSNHGIYFASSAPKFLWWGLFSIFQQKSASKAPKTCDFEYFTGQWKGSSLPPPWLRSCSYRWLFSWQYKDLEGKSLSGLLFTAKMLQKAMYLTSPTWAKLLT